MIPLALVLACTSEAELAEFVDFDSEAMVDAHNDVRAQYGVGPLEWDDALVTVAVDWSRHLVAGACELVHSGGEYGENLYWTSATTTPADVVGAWAAEAADYDLDSFECAPEPAVCGHFTQVVWADSTSLGCGAASCGEEAGEVWTCEYDPPGNWIGEAPF